MTDGTDPADTDRQEARLRSLLGVTAGRVAVGDPLSTVYAVRRRTRLRRIRRASGAGSVAVVVAAAITLASLVGPAGTVGGTPAPYRLTGALTSFSACSDYLSYVKDRAAKLVGPDGLTGSGPYGQLPAHLDSLATAAGAPYATLQQKSGSLAPPVTHSGTTDQVAGVDEPDTVKTDGRTVVTLTGPTLRVLDTGAHTLGSMHLNGDTGGGLLVAGDRAVVLSRTSPAPTFGGGVVDPGFFGSPVPTAAAPSASAAVVDLSDPSRPRLVRTFTFDGAVVAARLVDNRIRLVLRSDGPRLTFQNPTQPQNTKAATAANRALIKASTIDDWLPSWQAQSPDGATTPRHRLATCNAVARPTDASGISTISVFSLDPQTSAPGPATSLVAAGDTVYATADHLYVAGLTLTNNAQTGPGRTRMYAFSTSGGDQPRFLGAGSVPGSLIGPYAMDEGPKGLLRVATTAQNTNDASGSRISVLQLAGSSLHIIGTVHGLGLGQQLRAVRFLGDQAYVVTFRTFDPLYVVDLRNPRHPVVAGQLEQPGFSEFLYPLPHHRLLGVGVQITRNEPSGLAVATYDVADPAHPRRIAVSPLAMGFPGQGGYDPHAFLYWMPKNLAVLALPDIGGGGQAGAAAYRIGTGGSLTRAATLAHGGLTPTRSAVIGNALWAFTPGGVLVADLGNLHHTSWHPYT